MTAKHTPTPWETKENRKEGYDITTIDGVIVGTTHGRGAEMINKANARHIVKCVNCHDELITVCKGMLKDLEKVCSEAMYRNIDGDLVTPYTESMKKAKQALAKAEEE